LGNKNPAKNQCCMKTYTAPPLNTPVVFASGLLSSSYAGGNTPAFEFTKAPRGAGDLARRAGTHAGAWALKRPATPLCDDPNYLMNLPRLAIHVVH
jgi:hypothetical protein